MSDHAQELVKTIEVFKLDQIDYKPDLETQESQKLLEQPADYKNDPSKKDPKNNDDDLPDFEWWCIFEKIEFHLILFIVSAGLPDRELLIDPPLLFMISK